MTNLQSELPNSRATLPMSLCDAGLNAIEQEGPRLGVSHYLDRVLRVARKHFGMEIAFISEFYGERRIFRQVNTDTGAEVIRAGDSDPLSDSLCHAVVEGRLPQLIHNAQALAAARGFAATRRLPVGAHLSVPLRLRDGRVYGTFCCFSRSPNEALTERDVGMMQGYSELASEWIDCEVERAEQRRAMEHRVREMLSGESLEMHFQPIRNVAQNRTVGFEALARFPALPARPVNLWFEEARRAGVGVTLECHAIRQALKALPLLPAPAYVSVNISPEALLRADLQTLLADVDLSRVVIEVTEHAAIENYGEVTARLTHLRERGLRLAVDDAGAGYASFRHILNLAPDIIKLDISITRDIDKDASRRALASALIAFAEATSTLIVAEGVETKAELQALRALGVSKVQGYLIGRAVPLREAQAAMG